MTIIEWWNSLGIAAQVFYCIAVPATLVLLIQTVLMFLGLDEEADGIDDVLESVSGDVPDADPGQSPMDLADAGMGALQIFTLRGILAFFVVFGWVGVVMDGAGAQLVLTIPVAAASGFVMMVLIAYMLRAVMKLRSDGNTNNRNAIGTAGKVHLTIPASRAGEGKVHLMLQGAYVERGAVTDEDEAIPTGSEVVVVGVSGQTDLVVKRK